MQCKIPMPEEIFSVTDLTASIKKHLEKGFSSIQVRGEISNFKHQSSGHLYFTLKDANAQISAVLFKGHAQGLSRPPKDGDQVIARGELTVYPPRGSYQILVREMQYAGVGELLLKLHELKNKLEKQGWFDKSQKQPLPKMPKTIGVVTSPTGSVIQDILHVLTRRFQGFHLILNPVKVQGEGAAQEIAQAIEQFNQYRLADVLIVGRGGGSLEDLWAFNEEIVASAIHASQIPIISAVGHETDTSIADYVADVRAPTPSAAAEIAVAEKAKELSYLAQTQQRIKQAVHAQIREYRQRLRGIQRHPLLTSSDAVLAKPYQLLDEVSTRLNLNMREQLRQKRVQLSALHKQAASLRPTAQIPQLRSRLTQADKGIFVAISNRLQHKRQRLEQLVSHLRAIDPRNLLTKGYCILFHENTGSAILSSREVNVSDPLRIQMHDGQIITTVTKIHP